MVQTAPQIGHILMETFINLTTLESYQKFSTQTLIALSKIYDNSRNADMLQSKIAIRRILKDRLEGLDND